jgi:hypothetical protein
LQAQPAPWERVVRRGVSAARVMAIVLLSREVHP